ncbi:transcriptional regulator [Terrimonas sp.]|uniref:helix-turn-helix domain-containing protein n=1 Tax=Terrimonas sp. TaxID=1914338 RepID=UPI000D5107A5|nr:helix-turn-helix domain-containing protein [Terrimonas sp.]PVD49397.1 transcriptional regulator [Terrimonas sp.]
MKQQLSDRILEARKKKGISQQDLGKVAKVHFSNVGKYERGEAIPAADILNRIAKALDVTVDYLLNGTLQDKSADAINDEELLSQFRKIEQLPAEKKKLVKEFLDAFIFKSDLQKQLAS